MKEIELTQDEIVLVDDEDFKWLNTQKWCCLYGRKKYKYAQRGNGVLMHRIILNAQKGQYVDHIDGNGLNNQRSNLRICTNAQNLWNGKNHKDGSSRYKGVCRAWGRQNWQGWHAQIQIHGEKIHLGDYDSEIDAAHAYNKAALKHFGEFASLNNV